MPETSLTIHQFASAMELADILASTIAECLTAAINERNQASLVVSGGSTPKPLFAQLAAKKIDWHKVFITLADERWIDPTDPSSNENLTRLLLLQSHASSARFVGLKNNALKSIDAEQECHSAINAIPRPFDTVILGMGDDGHTASLFPGAEQLAAAVDMRSEKNCFFISPPSARYERMTMTLPVLLDSRKIILHITGESKKNVLKKAMAEGAANDMPIRWILRQHQTPVEIYWAP